MTPRVAGDRKPIGAGLTEEDPTAVDLTGAVRKGSRPAGGSSGRFAAPWGPAMMNGAC